MDKLSEGEIAVIFGLMLMEEKAATRDLAKILRRSEQYVRNNIYKLRKKGIVASLRPSQIAIGILFGSPIPEEATSKSKQKIHILKVDFDTLLKKHPEILEYSELILKIKTSEDLKKQIEQTRKKLKKRE
jgi:predicted transcriptional regulator